VKLRHRITVFAATGATLIALAAYGTLSPVLTDTSLLDAHVEAALLTGRMTSHVHEAGRLGQSYVANGRHEELLAFEASAEAFENELASYEYSIGNENHGEGTDLQVIRASWADVRALVGGRAAGLTGAVGRLLVRLNALAEHERDDAAHAMSALSATVGRARVIILVLAVGVIGIIIAVGAFAAHSVARPLAVLDAAVQRLAAGELGHEIPQVGYDEIRDLAAVFETMRTNLAAALSSLHDRIEEQSTTEEALAEANNDLNLLLDSAQRSGREMDLAGEMDELLQADLSWAEAYAVIASHGRRLFPEFQGAVYLYDHGRPVLMRVLEWGDAEPMAERYEPDECWSLRTVRAHWARSERPDLPPCEHLHAPGVCSACIPLVAHGDLLGTVVMRGCSGPDPCAQTGSYEHARAVLASFAVRVALAISNMQLRESLREQSLRDPLTGLYNRRIMEEALAREIARAGREATPLIVGLIDIDHFKEFNDTFGHAAGDHVLREVGAYLNDHTRAGDVVCRFGGEEFVVIWSETDIMAGFTRAEALRQGVGELSFKLDGTQLGQVTLSIGVALLGEHGDDGDALLSAADAAMYAAKAEGRNQVVLALPPARPLERETLLPGNDPSPRHCRIG
jgi:diguanylate cyclase (GGDEF)-like protein